MKYAAGDYVRVIAASRAGNSPYIPIGAEVRVLENLPHCQMLLLKHPDEIVGYSRRPAAYYYHYEEVAPV